MPVSRKSSRKTNKKVKRTRRRLSRRSRVGGGLFGPSCGDVFRARQTVQSLKDLKPSARIKYNLCKHLLSRGKYDRVFPRRRISKNESDYSYKPFTKTETSKAQGLFNQVNTALLEATKKDNTLTAKGAAKIISAIKTDEPGYLDYLRMRQKRVHTTKGKDEEYLKSLTQLRTRKNSR